MGIHYTYTPNTHNHTTNKRKTLKGSSKRAKRCNSEPERLSFTTKKRIQVPLHHPQETPTRPPNRECDRSEFIKDRTQSNVPGLEDGAHLHETGEALFSPFFWHRDEEDAEKPTQLTPLPNDSPADAPCFSDLMGSDDDNSRGIASKDAKNIDSEMFEWTQRPCSPELCATPVKMQVIYFVNCFSMPESKLISSHMRHVPPSSYLQDLNLELGYRTKYLMDMTEKRTKKTAENTQKKRVKSGTDEVVGIDILPLKADQDKGSSTSKLVKCKKQNSKRGKKVPVETSSTEALISKSTEESDISGCMTHYLKGKPIALDHEGAAGAIHAHRNCTEWAPNVYFEDDIAVNLEAELARSKRIKCSCCGLKGAALGCYEKSCHRSFHFTCAKLTPECKWDEVRINMSYYI
nr:protein breast cancer susceptibility 1 homolog [Tanacetum cinerariifolium]